MATMRTTTKNTARWTRGHRYSRVPTVTNQNQGCRLEVTVLAWLGLEADRKADVTRASRVARSSSPVS